MKYAVGRNWHEHGNDSEKKPVLAEMHQGLSQKQRRK